jgi:hypothetical protein
MVHRFGARKAVAVFAVAGSLFAGGVFTAAQSNAASVTGPDGKTYQVDGHLGSKAVPSGSGSWSRAFRDCSRDPDFGDKVRSVKKFRSYDGVYWDGEETWHVVLDDYFCSSSARP